MELQSLVTPSPQASDAPGYVNGSLSSQSPSQMVKPSPSLSGVGQVPESALVVPESPLASEPGIPLSDRVMQLDEPGSQKSPGSQSSWVSQGSPTPPPPQLQAGRTNEMSRMAIGDVHEDSRPKMREELDMLNPFGRTVSAHRLEKF